MPFPLGAVYMVGWVLFDRWKAACFSLTNVNVLKVLLCFLQQARKPSWLDSVKSRRRDSTPAKKLYTTARLRWSIPNGLCNHFHPPTAQATSINLPTDLTTEARSSFQIMCMLLMMSAPVQTPGHRNKEQRVPDLPQKGSVQLFLFF